MTNLTTLAKQENLELISTTDSQNGYPHNEMQAVIGFDSFEQAEELAEKNNLSVEIFTKRNGNDFWFRTGNKAYEAFERESADYGEDCTTYTKEDVEKYYTNEIEGMLSDFEDLDELSAFVDSHKAIYAALKNLKDGELLIVCNGEVCDTVQQTTMSYENDSRMYAIGLISRG
ncbi:MAG: hypothetical protein HG466_005665 [Prevotella sp.]|nr:hypothetical protein [Prevotella sp.]